MFQLITRRIQLYLNQYQLKKKPSDRRAFTLDDESTNSESQVRRRAGRMNRNAQGPIMSTKRKRLDGKLDIPGEQKISKKRLSVH